MANFESQIPFGLESFALHVHVEQVFFYDAHDEPRWKLVQRKEVQSKQIFQAASVAEDQRMFQTGYDVDHEGLRSVAEVPEVDPPTRQMGRTLRREDAMGHFMKRTQYPTRMSDNRGPHPLMKRETCKGESSKTALDTNFN